LQHSFSLLEVLLQHLQVSHALVTGYWQHADTQIAEPAEHQHGIEARDPKWWGAKASAAPQKPEAAFSVWGTMAASGGKDTRVAPPYVPIPPASTKIAGVWASAVPATGWTPAIPAIEYTPDSSMENNQPSPPAAPKGPRQRTQPHPQPQPQHHNQPQSRPQPQPQSQSQSQPRPQPQPKSAQWGQPVQSAQPAQSALPTAKKLSLSATTVDNTFCRKWPDNISSDGAEATVLGASTSIQVTCWTMPSLDGDYGKVQGETVWLKTAAGCFVNMKNLKEFQDYQTELAQCPSTQKHWVGTLQPQYKREDCYSCPNQDCSSQNLGEGPFLDIDCYTEGETISGNR
jgi:hypothetical protein